MAEVRTLEEFVRGPDGDGSKALPVTVARVCGDAQAGEVERVRIECRTTPLGSSQSRKEWQSTFSPKDPQAAILDAIMRQLEGSPGETFSGELRLNFKVHGSSDHISSYTRKMRPAISGDLVDSEGRGELAGDLMQVRGHFDNLVKPLADQLISQVHAATGMMNAAATMMQAAKPTPTPAPTASGSMIHDLLRGAMHIAGENSSTERRAAQPGAVRQVPPPPPRALAPPGPPGMPMPQLGPPAPGSYDSPKQPRPAARPALPAPSNSAPTPPANISRADVIAWARAHEGEAQAMVMELLDERGFTITAKGA